MTALLFLTFVTATALALAALVALYLPKRTAFGVMAGLAVWLLYGGVLGVLGVIGNPTLRPPGIVFVVAPVVLFVFIVLVRSPAGGRAALAFPLWVLLGFQVFRVGVELFIHQLWIEGLAPRLLTFEGANIDILIGVSAPLVAWLSTKGRWGLRVAFVWSLFGLATLANVVIRSALTAPGPLHVVTTDIPNLMIGTFPFTFIPGFFVPLAVTLHVLALRAVRDRLGGAVKRVRHQVLA